LNLGMRFSFLSRVFFNSRPGFLSLLFAVIARKNIKTDRSVADVFKEKDQCFFFSALCKIHACFLGVLRPPVKPMPASRMRRIIFAKIYYPVPMDMP